MLLNGQGYQQFQDKWIPVESTNPIDTLSTLLDNAANKGQYEKMPITTTSISDDTDGIDSELYRITLYNESVDWLAFCDAQIDSFLGGNPFSFNSADVQLYYGATSHILSLVLFSAASEDASLTGAILIRPTAKKDLTIAESDITRSDEIKKKLPEAWSLYSPELDTPKAPAPCGETLHTLQEEWASGNYNTFALQDTILHFPCTVQEVLGIGFTSSIPANEAIEAGAQGRVHFQYHGSTVTVLYQNTATESISFSDCAITSIALFLDDLPDISVALPGGLPLNTSISEIEKCWNVSGSDDFAYTFGTMIIKLYALQDIVYGIEISAHTE